MVYVISTEQSITDIADAIRDKTGSSDPISIPDMPTAIESISGGGVYEVNINGNNCSYHEIETNWNDVPIYGDFKENGDQNFDEVIEAFASGYQVIVHLTYNNHTYDGVVWDVFDHSTLTEYYYPEGGITRFTGAGFLAGCKISDNSAKDLLTLSFFCNEAVVSSYHDS